MSLEEEIVDLSITVTDAAPTRAGFGTPLIALYHTAWALSGNDLVREYSKPGDLLDDGFTTSSPAYKIAQVIKSQQPAPKTFKVGRLRTAPTQVIHLIPTVTTEGVIYSGTINGQNFTYTVGAAATVQVIVEAVELLVEALTGVSSTEDNTKVVVTADTAGAILDYTLSSNWRVLDATADGATAADLAAIAAEDNDWYGLVLANNSEAILTLGAAFVEANKKIMVAQTADWDVADAGEVGDLATALKALSYQRTGVLFHKRIGGSEWAGAGWLAGRLAVDPGSDTWAHKRIAGVTVNPLSAGENSALKAKNATSYSVAYGLPVTFEGKAAGGRFLDTTRFIDWLDNDMRTAVFAVIANNPKVPYTNPGIAIIEGAVHGSLQRGVQRGGLSADPAPRVEVPDVADVDTADKAERVLRDVSFFATLAGAIHKTIIEGTVSV